MNYLKTKEDNVNLCYQDTCVSASGTNGKLIVYGVLVVLVSVAIYYLSKIK